MNGLGVGFGSSPEDLAEQKAERAAAAAQPGLIEGEPRPRYALGRTVDAAAVIADSSTIRRLAG